jgi:hypothetical protein
MDCQQAIRIRTLRGLRGQPILEMGTVTGALSPMPLRYACMPNWTYLTETFQCSYVIICWNMTSF